MKQLSIIAVAAALFLGGYVNVEAQQRIQLGQFPISVTTTAAAVVSTNLYCKSATFVGKDEFRVDSVDTVYIGFSATDDAQYYPLAPGGTVVITAPEGKSFNLKTVYVDAASTPADICVIYVPD